MRSRWDLPPAHPRGRTPRGTQSGPGGAGGRAVGRRGSLGGGRLVSSGARGPRLGGTGAPGGCGRERRVCPAVRPACSCRPREGRSARGYTSATAAASARPMLAALLRRRGLGVAAAPGAGAAPGVVAALPPSPGQPCCRRMSAHSWLPAWRA